MRFYYVNPANTAEISEPYVLGQVNVTLPDGRQVARIFGAIPEWDLYEGIPDTTPQPAYTDRTGRTLAFVGTPKDPAATVQETEVYEQFSLDRLLAEKTAELDNHAEFIRVQNFFFNAQFWVVYDQRARDRFAGASNVLLDRLKDRTIGQVSSDDPIIVSDPATYWARDLNVELIKNSNGNRLVTAVDEPTWGQVMKKAATYDFAVSDAYVAATNDIDGAYTAADWNALAAIDVTSAVYGWPDYYSGPVSTGLRVV